MKVHYDSRTNTLTVLLDASQRITQTRKIEFEATEYP